MANEKFKVKFGLAVGDTAATIDATTGDIVTNGDLFLGGKNIFPGATDDIIQIENNTTTTNDFYPALILKTTTTGTPAVGLGPALAFTGQTGASNFENAGYIAVESTDITPGSEDFEMRFGLMTGGATWATKLTLDSLGNLTTNAGSSIINGPNRFTSPTINAFQGSTSPSRGLSISNGNGSSAALARNALVLRTYPTAGGARAQVLFENARGTETTPTAITSGDLIGEISSSGYATNGWLSDYVVAVPGVAQFTATETWANTGGPYPTAGTVTNAGTGYQIALQPTATTVTTSNGSRINVLNINPQTFAHRSDSYTWANGKTGTTQTMSLDVSGNLIITGDLTVTGNDIKSSSATALTLSGADVAVAGDLTVTGNEIKSSGTNTVLQFDDVNARVAGELTITGNKIRSSGGSAFPLGDIAIELSGTDVTVPGDIQGATILTVGPFDTSQTVTANTTLLDTNTAAGGVFGVVTRYKASSGATNLTVPQSGYRMGGFKVNGFADTAGTDGTLAGQVSVKVTENWTTTANGTAIEFLANKQGEDWTTGHKVVISASPESSLIASDIITLENSAGTDYATFNSSGTALTGDLDVRGGDITNSTGALQIATTSNGNLTLAPNGTGNVVLTLANGGNLTNDRNYVFGAIRNSTTAAAGDIWAVNASTSFHPLRGISIDNSADTTKFPGLVLRTYNATSTNRGRVVLERARGTAASPTAVQSGDFLGEISVSGYSSTGWVNDNIPTSTGFFGFTASENWVSNTSLGTNFSLSLAPQTTTISTTANLVACLAIRPESAVLKGDQFAIARAKTSAFVATGCSTSTSVLTIGTVTSGTPAVGQVVQTSTLGFLNSTYIVSNVSGSGSGSVWNLSSSPGTLSSLTVTGQTGFIGSPSAATTVDALADLRLLSNTIKGSGGTTQITTSSAGATLALAGDTITLESSAGTDYAVLNSTSATFAQPVGLPVKTATAWNAITGAVGQMVCVSDSAQGSNPNGMMAFWDTTNSRWSYIHDNSAV